MYPSATASESQASDNPMQTYCIWYTSNIELADGKFKSGRATIILSQDAERKNEMKKATLALLQQDEVPIHTLAGSGWFSC